MLEPNSRRLLMESLQPPDGFRLDWAVGTSYSLDLLALLSAPVAFAFSDWQDRDGRPSADPLALLKAVRQYADRICLFCQAGKIHVPKTYQPLLASLEESVVEANAPLGGSFHPKLWFLRFVDGESVVFRLLCLSRNMTFDRSWDTLLRLEGPLRERTNAFAKNHPLGQFVEALPQMSARGLSATWRERIEQLAYEIRRVEFEIPEPFEELEFWPLGIGSPNSKPFRERMDRILVVSPFVDDGFLGELAQRQIPMQLLSRGESLARLQEATLDRFDKVWVLDDTATPEPGETEEQEPVEEGHANAGLQADGDANRDIPLVGLHAKVYVVDEGWNASVFTGSANATAAAFHRNVEFLVQLRGKKSRCGIDAILGQAEENGQKLASSLADLLQPYVRAAEGDQTDAEAEAFERQVDQLAKELAAAGPTARCEAGAEPGSFSLRISSPAGKQISTVGCRLRARPISLGASHFRDVNLLEACWTEFSPVSLLGLTSFFIFEAESTTLQLRRQFVLNIPLENVPENRQEAILRELLSDRGRVLRFLLLLLLDTGVRDLSKLFAASTDGTGTFSFVQSLFGATLFESLVRALDRDPERLDQVAATVEDLRKTNEGRELLPDDFDAIWAPIWSARKRQLERNGKMNRSAKGNA